MTAGWYQTTEPPKMPPMQLNVDGGLAGRDELTPLDNRTTQIGNIGMRNFYSRLLGGYAERFEPPVLEGPPRAWCAGDNCVLGHCNGFHTTCTPIGVVYPRSLLNTSDWQHVDKVNSTDGSKPLLWGMNSAYYSSLQRTVESIDRTTHAALGLEDMRFGRGGFQVGQATPAVSAFYLQNVLEELDSHGEYFYENATGDLWYMMNSTSERDAQFVSPALKTIVKVLGDAEAPVKDVEFVNLSFAFSASTYLEPYSTLLGGGDYANSLNGALHARGRPDREKLHVCRRRRQRDAAVQVFAQRCDFGL